MKKVNGSLEGSFIAQQWIPLTTIQLHFVGGGTLSKIELLQFFAGSELDKEKKQVLCVRIGLALVLPWMAGTW
jgi:hypothetical protein